MKEMFGSVSIMSVGPVLLLSITTTDSERQESERTEETERGDSVTIIVRRY